MLKSMPTNPQLKLGRYELIREVARSNDIVFEGWDPVTHRRVAVKVLNIPDGASDDQRADRKKRFDREARAAARLHHQNIVTLFDYGTEGEKDFLVFGFIEGSTLADLLIQNGPLDKDIAIEYSKQILAALAYAHAQGVVHRDIKPSNIFICGDCIKISDLGIARIESEASVTTNGQVFGTPAYMSPEQVRGLDVDRRVDVWAAGVVLYQMVTGTQPFKGGSVLEIGSSVLNAEPDLELVQDDTLRDVVAKALNKDPEQRFQTAREMVIGLETGVASPVASAVALAVAAPALPAAPKLPSARGRLAMTWAGTCLAAAVIGGGLVLYAAKPPPAPLVPAKPVEVASNYIPKSMEDVFEEAWEHNSLHELTSSDEYRALATGAQSDKIDTWCRETIGKDYLALGQDDRDRLVAELQDQFKNQTQLNALGQSEPTNQLVTSKSPVPNGKSMAVSNPVDNSSSKGYIGSQAMTFPVSPPSTPLYSPAPAPSAQPAPAPPPSVVADNTPESNRGRVFPDQQSHDLEDLEVLRKLHFTPDRPPTIERGGVRVYSGPDGTVRIR
jgi:serine/threonine protein kinase